MPTIKPPVQGIFCAEHGMRNWQWLAQLQDQVLLVDPAYSQPLEQLLKQRGLDRVDAIVITHDDFDHVDAVDYFAGKYSAQVLALSQDQEVELGAFSIRSFSTPGHRRQHCSFSLNLEGQAYFFSGDLLFVGGCGRVFTGDYQAMVDSLAKVRARVDPSAILCSGHDYSQSNFAFIKHLGLDNPDFERVRQHYPLFREGDICSPQLTLGDEAGYNPFLRFDKPDVLKALARHGYQGRAPSQALRALRQIKESL